VSTISETPGDMVRRVRVAPGRAFRLARRAPDARLGFRDREQADAATARTGERLADLGTRLTASRAKALLIVLQGMDASGKDGTVRRCVQPLNPISVRVAAFKAPTPTELAHDFLWRISAELPQRGQVGVFNRSHYEDVLVARVEELVPESVWRPRYEAINAFERHLVNEGTVIVKLFLHISREEQAQRFRERIANPAKNWKFNLDDLRKRERWDEYMEAYEEAIRRTSTPWAPWYVIPADRKWVRNAVVTSVVTAALDGLGLEYPELDPALRDVVVV
jgi:PPK2 family polyphosphate:nucleotide phosphotransferase